MAFLKGADMRLLLKSSLLFCLFLYGQAVFGQNKDRNLCIGIDVFKNLPPLVKGYFFQKSLIVEPSLLIPLGNKSWYLNISPGYSAIQANPIYKNLDYNNQGIFLKAGLNYLAGDYLSFGVLACFSRYDEFGSYVLKGPYYGGVVFPFNRRQLNVLGSELQMMYGIPVHKQVYIALISRGGIHNLNRGLSPDSYFIPGMGVTSRDFNITAGLSVNVQYAIPVK